MKIKGGDTYDIDWECKAKVSGFSFKVIEGNECDKYLAVRAFTLISCILTILALGAGIASTLGKKANFPGLLLSMVAFVLEFIAVIIWVDLIDSDSRKDLSMSLFLVVPILAYRFFSCLSLAG